MVFNVVLGSGKDFDTPFSLIKKDKPIETAKFIRNSIVESERGGKYETWAKKILVRSQRNIRRLRRYHNIDGIMRQRKSA